MLHSRNAALLLVTVVIAGAALLWWNRADDRAPDTLPTSADTVEADNPVGAVEGVAAPEAALARVEATSNPTKAAANTASPTGPSDLHVLAVWPDETPAAGVMVYLHRSVRRLSDVAFARGLTDTAGLVVFKDTPLGPSTLASDRQDKQKVTVEGGRQEVTFKLNGGIAVRGTVRNPSGTPVAYANVWLQSSSTNWTGGRTVGVTDSAGEFTLEQILPEMSLGAFAAGYAPSMLVDLDIVDRTNLPAVVELTLLPDAGQLEGSVTNADNEPIAGAVVAVGENPRFPAYDGTRYIEQWTPRTAETDEDGYFWIDGLAVGEQTIAIRAEGYGLWRSEESIERDTASFVSPILQRVATLSGTVTDGEGAPLAEVAVRAYDQKPGTGTLAGGHLSFWKTFGYRAAITGPDGKYQIEDVTPGTVHVFAQRENKHDGVSVAYAREQLQLEPGIQALWNPVIEEGASIEGIVIYASGEPIPGLFVTVFDEKDGGENHTIVSSSQGVFRFLSLEDSTYQIRVQTPFVAPQDAPPLRVEGVIPNKGRTVLQATYDKPTKQKHGNVIGRIDDVAGRIRNPSGTTITLHSDARWSRSGRKINNGAFRFKSVPPCRFRITLKENRTVLAESGWFDLKPAATLDVGTLITEPGGEVRIVLERATGTERLEPEIYLKRPQDKSSTVIQAGRRTELVADNLTPGDFNVTGYCNGMVSLNAQVQVVAGQTTTVKFSLRAGATLRGDVWWPVGEVQSTSRKYRILNAEDGSLLHENESDLTGYPTRPNHIYYTVPRGRWKIEFSTDDGLRGEVEFAVQNLDETTRPRINLK